MTEATEIHIPPYLTRLDDAQRKAALDVNGYVAIHACAGAGKTAVLAARVAHLLNSGILPEQIMCITFTNKAADEMRSRIEDYSQRDISHMLVGTYHSICASILKEHGVAIGVAPGFTIYDEADSLLVMRKMLKQSCIDPKQIKEWAGEIQQFKSQLLDEDDWYIQLAHARGEHYADLFRQVYNSYQSGLKNTNALDFDDLTRNTTRLLSSCPDVQRQVSSQFRYILVDEYQDTSRIEAELLRLLSYYHGNLCVVGDVRQSVYSFKGSDYKLMLDFEKTYLGAKKHVLHVNYRSAKTIVDTAERLMSNTTTQSGYSCIANRKESGEVIRLRFESDIEEAEVIAKAVQELVATGLSEYSDIAVLSRIRSVYKQLEETFRRHSIPHTSGAPEWLSSPEVKYTLAYLRLVIDPDDHTALGELLRLGGDTRDRLSEIRQSVNRLKGMYVCGVQLQHFLETVSRLVKRDLSHDSQGTLYKLKEEAATQTGHVQDALPALLDSLSGVDAVDNIDAVRLMTIHQSKGLEFKIVFLIGIDDGILPCRQSIGDDVALEEERRLLYVAMTRATDYLCLCSSRLRHASPWVRSYDVSRFLPESLPIKAQ